MRVATPETWYEVRLLEDGVAHIEEPFIKPFYRCNIWHVRGRDRDLLVDSGMGVVSLRHEVARLAERPVLAVATHTHFDHIGSHHEFAERLVHGAEAELMTSPTRKATLADRYVSDDIFTALPPGRFRAEAYEVTPAPPTRLIADGDRIDLGDRSFEVLHLPGHSPGSIGLWEEATGILFSGDVVYDGPLVDDCYHSDLGDYLRTMERLLDLPVRVVRGGHFPSFGRERFRELIGAFLGAKRPSTGQRLNG
jgi:glyoxylase-like metal-dependent hydrolase (beta-lactamase superfamily II)